MKNSSPTSKKQTNAAPPTNARRTLGAISFVLNALALLATVWIVVPAPSVYVWLWSVAASEWSFMFGALALFATVGAICSGGGRIKFASVILGAIAITLSLYPCFSAFSAARKHGVSLSLRQYVFGWRTAENAGDVKTFAFANIDGKALNLDVYSPPESVSKNGASVVVVHGGGWSAGVRSDFPQWNEWLAAQGFTVFDIDYRLAPQPNYLTATGDVKCAVGWVKRNAEQFEISPDKIVLLGRSAGAHLALLAAYSANDARIPSSCGAKEDGENSPRADETVRGVVSLYAPIDLLWGFDNPANQSVIDGPKTLADFLGGNPRDSEEARARFLLASPLSHVNDKTPPTLLVHGGRDQLVRSENMTFLAERLNGRNVPHETVFLSYAQHGFDYNFNGWGAQVVKSEILDFFHGESRIK